MRGAVVCAIVALGGCIVALGGCIVAQHIGPGILNPHWQEPPRDPDPTRDPTKQQTSILWDEKSATPGVDPPKVELAKRTIATLAAVLAGGWIPMIYWYGTFEEVPAARKHRRH